MSDPFDYIEARDDADELIQDFGTSAQVKTVTNSGSELEPTQTTGSTATFAVRVEFTTKHRAKWNVLQTDQRWLVAAGPLGATVPQPGNKLAVGGATVGEIIEADPLNTNGTAVMYDVQVRV